ncbi:MAG: FecR domain-containing protein [Pseudomonas sp.]
MNAPVETDLTDDNSVDAQAALWFSRNRGANADPQAFAQWLAEPAHAQAYAEFEALWGELGALQPAARVAPVTVLQPRRRRAWRPALAVAAAVLCAFLAMNLGAPQTLYKQQVAAQSQGSRELALPDGSTLFVNANTRLSIDFTAHRRDIHLLQGQLYIEVAPDKERPLWVHSGDAQVRVVGTGFDVRRGQRQLVVTVAHGQVAVMPTPQSEPTMLTAEQRASYDYRSGQVQQTVVDSSQVADWRSGHLSFRNRDLASLVDELALYRNQPVQLSDPALASYKVSGSLDVNDPDALLRALPALLPVRTVILGDGRARIQPRKK